jgi:ABC-type uncharacterized transport system involved in gliding motility auxiliary subunit
MTKSRLLTLASFLLLFVGLVAVNVLAGVLSVRLDLTRQRLYTLTSGTRRILETLPDPVTVKLFVPESVPDAPVLVKSFARKARELLKEYQGAARGKLTLQVYDPQPDSEDEEWAQRYGLTAARLGDGTPLYFGLVVLSGGREAAVPYLDPRRERYLEYDISQAITRVNRKAKPRVAVMSWLPLMGQGGRPMGPPEGEWFVMEELRKSYEVQYVFPEDSLREIPDGTNLLVLVHPKRPSATVSYAIDQYLMRGGRMIAFLDPNSRADPAGAAGMGAEAGGMDALLKAWGIQYDPGKVVADRTLATRVSTPNQGPIDFPLWISLHRRELNHDLAITSDLEEVTLIDAGAFATAKEFKHSFIPVFTSSKQSGLMDVAAVRFASPTDIAKQMQTDGTARVLAGLLSGKLDSAFPAGAPPEPKPAAAPRPPAAPPPKPAERKHAHRAASEQETSVLLVGDADFLADRFSVQVSNFFGNRVAQPINDNLSFALNAVEFMTGSQDLIQIRSRGQIFRPFTRVAELQVKAGLRYQEQERLLSQRLEEVKRKLTGVEQRQQPGQKLVLSPAQLEEVAKFRREEARVRQELREVRKVLRQDIEALGNVLLALNLLLVPLAVAAAGFVVVLRRSQRR